MTGQLLNRLRRGSTHREMRAEGVPQLVDVAGDGKAAGSLRALQPAPQGVLTDWLPVALVEHPRSSKVPDRLESGSEAGGHPDPAPFAPPGRAAPAPPVRARHRGLARAETRRVPVGEP